MVAKLTPEEVNKRVVELRSRGIELVSPFTKMSDNHDFRCLKCNNVWNRELSYIYTDKKGCPVCGARSLKQNDIDTRIKALKDRGIELISPFTRTNDKHTFKCVKGHQWDTLFSTVFTAKKGCPFCTGRLVDDATISKRVNEVEARGIKVIDKIDKVDCTYIFGCKTCNHVWKNTFTLIYRGQGCPKCAGRYLDPETIRDRIQELHNRGIVLASPFIRIGAKHDFKCLVCDHGWNASFDVVYRVSGCPKCSGKARTPEEKLISESHSILRTRLHNLIARKGLTGKPYRDSNGRTNEFYRQLFPYWQEQYRNFLMNNPKPTKGVWHLDHIIPASWFDPFDLEQVKICWNHQNLQWLTESENTSKRDNIRSQDITKFTDFHWYALEKCSFPKVKLKRPC